MRKQLIIYCDESADKGPHYSHFYGSALIDAAEREAISKRLDAVKVENNLFGELKWTKITESYAEKYISFLKAFFDEIAQGSIKIRIMFLQNMYVAQGLDEYQIDNEYFLLYYQMVKHSFGFRHIDFGEDGVSLSLFLDDIPDKSGTKYEDFKRFLNSLENDFKFKRANIKVPLDGITDVKSDKHVIMQGLDIILGSMYFRLNDFHKTIPPGKRRRGKRTKAKEMVYKYINKRIKEIYSNFNIGISTATANGPDDRWHHPYRHWNFIPSNHTIDSRLTKAYKRKRPRQ